MFAEDLDPFFDTATGFAVSASRTPAAGGSAQAGVVIFDEPGVLLEDAGVVTAEPTALFPATQWGGGAVGDTIALASGDLPAHLVQLAGSYKVRQVLPVDDGATKRLVLVRTA
jgi:hypothetical protein